MFFRALGGFSRAAAFESSAGNLASGLQGFVRRTQQPAAKFLEWAPSIGIGLFIGSLLADHIEKNNFGGLRQRSLTLTDSLLPSDDNKHAAMERNPAGLRLRTTKRLPSMLEYLIPCDISLGNCALLRGSTPSILKTREEYYRDYKEANNAYQSRMDAWSAMCEANGVETSGFQKEMRTKVNPWAAIHDLPEENRAEMQNELNTLLWESYSLTRGCMGTKYLIYSPHVLFVMWFRGVVQTWHAQHTRGGQVAWDVSLAAYVAMAMELFIFEKLYDQFIKDAQHVDVCDGGIPFGKVLMRAARVRLRGITDECPRLHRPCLLFGV